LKDLTYDYKDRAPDVLAAGSTDGKVRRSGYLSDEIRSHYLYNIVIGAPGNPPGMEKRVRKVLASVDPNLVLYSVDPYTRILSADFQQENMIATDNALW